MIVDSSCTPRISPSMKPASFPVSMTTPSSTTTVVRAAEFWKAPLAIDQPVGSEPGGPPPPPPPPPESALGGGDGGAHGVQPPQYELYALHFVVHGASKMALLSHHDSQGRAGGGGGEAPQGAGVASSSNGLKMSPSTPPTTHLYVVSSLTDVCPLRENSNVTVLSLSSASPCTLSAQDDFPA